MKVQIGQQLAPFTVETLDGTRLSVPDPGSAYTHLQFRRFAGCPICNYHLHTFFQRRAEIESARIREVIVFHSSASEMRKYQDNITHAAVADPGMVLYAKFGVGRSWLASLHLRALWAALRGMLLGRMGLKMENGPFGLPADILIDRNGVVVAAKYGRDAYDQWEVDEVLALAAPPNGAGAAAPAGA